MENIPEFVSGASYQKKFDYSLECDKCYSSLVNKFTSVVKESNKSCFIIRLWSCYGKDDILTEEYIRSRIPKYKWDGINKFVSELTKKKYPHNFQYWTDNKKVNHFIVNPNNTEVCDDPGFEDYQAHFGIWIKLY